MHALKFLEFRIPPPVVALLIALAMWWVSSLPSPVDRPPIARLAIAIALAAFGLGFNLSGVFAFHRAKTTVNPMKPLSTSSLVVAGVYKITRNPMYVGLLFLLLAWAAFLWSAWSLLGLFLFVAYVTRFQIVPEERVLAALFGNEYAAYKTRVRRWL